MADRLGLVVTPTLYVGESHALYEYPGTMVIKPEHFRGYLEDMCKSLIKWGIRRFCFITPHLGNVPIIAQMSRDLMDAHGVRMCQIDWWRIIQPICAKEQITVHNDVMAHGHASEAGTSCLLYLRPDLVDMSLAACVPPMKKDAFPDIQYYNKTFRTCKTETGTLGDGAVMNRGGIITHLVRFSQVLVGRLPGGLGQTAVVINMIMAGMSGSAVADTSATGAVLIPALKQDKYSPGFSAALIAGASTIGPVIPPSIPLILIGAITGVSVGQLFMGGVVPGFLMGFALMIYTFFYAKRHNLRQLEKPTFREVCTSTFQAILPLGLAIVILGSIVTGIATPTEAAVLGVVYSTALVFLYYRNMDIKSFLKILTEAGLASGMVMFLVTSAQIFSWIATAEQLGPKLSALLFSITANPTVILIMLNILLLILGMLFSCNSIILLMTPILYPISQSIGMDGVHFGVMMNLNLMIGLLTPPFGMNLFITAAIAEIPIGEVVRNVWPFILVLLCVLMLVTYIPSLVTCVPDLLFKN